MTVSENDFENTTEQDIFWMQKAVALAKQAADVQEVPVGALIVKNNECIADGFNQPILKHDPTAHAEIIALRKAGEQLGNYRLIDCTLYVTLEPCPMCAMAMVHARIKRLVVGTPDPRTGAAGSVFNLVHSASLNHQIEYQQNVLATECSAILKQFFQRRR